MVAHQQYEGFILHIIGDLFWIGMGVRLRLYPLAAIESVYLFINFRALHVRGMLDYDLLFDYFAIFLMVLVSNFPRQEGRGGVCRSAWRKSPLARFLYRNRMLEYKG